MPRKTTGTTVPETKKTADSQPKSGKTGTPVPITARQDAFTARYGDTEVHFDKGRCTNPSALTPAILYHMRTAAKFRFDE